MLILLLSKTFVFCGFLYSCIILIRDLFFFLLHANSNSRFTGVSKNKVQRGANLNTHAIAQFLIVPLGIKIHSIVVRTRKYAIQCKEDFVASNPKIFVNFCQKKNNFALLLNAVTNFV